MVDRQAADSEAPTGSTKNWNDPMPHGVTEYQVNKLSPNLILNPLKTGLN